MTYILIILAIGLVLSPLLAMQPSPRQRQQQRLRARAMARGLQVQFIRRGKPPADTVDKAIGYRLPVAPHHGLSRQLPLPLVLERVDRAWSTSSTIAAPLLPSLTACLDSLPDDVFRVTLASRRLEAEWFERGNVDDVDRIADALEGALEFVLARSPTSVAGSDGS